MSKIVRVNCQFLDLMSKNLPLNLKTSPVGALVSKDGLRQWDADTWAHANHKALLKPVTYTQGVSKSISAAYWICLNPDGTVQSKAPLSVSTGKDAQNKQTSQVEQALQRAINKSKLLYEGAPVVDGQPIGMIVLYRPTGTLHVFPYLFDVQPYMVSRA